MEDSKSNDSPMLNSVYKFFYDENKKNKNVPRDISTVIQSLIETGWLDKENRVRETVSTSLLQLADFHAQPILHAVIQFRKSRSKLSFSQLHSLLKLVELICQKHPGEILPPLLNQIIEFSLEELMKTPQDPLPASAILVALAQNHCNNVMECVQPKMETENLPNVSIVYTIGHLCTVADFMPFIQPILDKVVNMLTLVKSDDYRCAFSYTLGKLCEAIAEHLSSCKDSSSVSKETFSSQLAIAFNCLFTFWLNNKDNKVCEAVLTALSPMFDLLAEDFLSQTVGHLLTGLLQLYRRAPALPRHCVTSCLASLLCVASVKRVEPHVDLIICTLHPMVWAVVDYDTGHPTFFRNHNEALRCYGEISKHFSSRLDEILLRHLSSGTEQDKIISLVICKHLLNSSGTLLKELIPAVHQLINDTSVKLRKVLVKIIVELAYRNHLSGTDSNLIEFLVKNCAIQGDGSDWLDLQETCQRTVYALSTTVKNVQPLMWNVLLRMLLAPELPTAVSIIAKSLAYLAQEDNFKMERIDDGIERSKQINSKAVLARCLCLLGAPFNYDRGPALCDFLKHYAPTVEPKLATVVTEKIPPLVDYLKLSDWNEDEWEYLLLDTAHAIVSTMDKDWIMNFASQLSVQFYVCSESLKAERASLMYCLSVTLCLVEDKAIIHSHLDTIINTLRTNTSASSQICAKAVGIVARKHLTLVLNRLDTLVKSELTRKSSRLLGLLRDARQEIEIEKARLTLLYCYAYVVKEAPCSELAPHLSTLLQFFIVQLTQCKEGDCNDACLMAIDNTMRSVLKSPIILDSGAEYKTQIMSLVMSQVQNQSIAPKPVLLKTISSLLKLPPTLPINECSGILKVTINKVIQNINEVSAKQSTLHELWTLLEVILDQYATSYLLTEIISLLGSWINNAEVVIRSCALSTLHTSLVAFHSNIAFHLSDSTRLTCTGLIVGNTSVRACETDPSIRLPALRCTQTLLQLALCYEGHVSPDSELQIVFSDLSNETVTNVNVLSNIICAKLPYSQLNEYALSLIEGVQDKTQSSAEGTAKLLTLVSESKGAELYHHVNELQERIFSQMSSDVGEQLIPTVLALVRHHPSIVINGLLTQSLPYNSNFVKVWHELAQSSSSNDTIRQLTRCLSGNLFIDGKHHRENIAAHHSLSAVTALSEMFSQSSIQPILHSYFSELFSTLLMVLGAYIGTQPPAYTPNKTSSVLFIPNRHVMKLVPSCETYKALKSLLNAVECTKGVESLAECAQLEFNNKIEVVLPCISSCIRHVCEHVNTASVAKILTSINSVNCKTESQKILIASVRAALVSNGSMLDPVLLDSVIDAVLDGLEDSSPSVLVCSYKALSSFAYLDHQQVGRHKDAVLEALTRGVEKYDPEYQEVALEAMTGLGLLLPQLPHNTLASVLIPLAITLKPFFEKEKIDLRCKALQIFGQLSTFHISSEKDSLREQFLSNLVCFLMHVNQINQEVANTCRATLFQSIQLLENENLTNTVKKYIAEDLSNQASQYFGLLKELTEGLIVSVPDSVHTLIMTSLNYTKSSHSLIRANSALFMGLLYYAWKQADDCVEDISTRLISLLKDSDPIVKMNAAQALGYVYVNFVTPPKQMIENKT